MAKLMTPLFVNGTFNRNGNKIRVDLLKTVSNGADTFKIYQPAGNPENDHPQAENDKYYLLFEVNGYLSPLSMTEWTLEGVCGNDAAVYEIFGSREEYAEYYRGENHSSAERLEMNKRLEEAVHKIGSEPERQAAYIRRRLDNEITIYQNSKENGGQTFPPCVGACALGELEEWQRLKAVYAVVREAEERERRRTAEEEERQEQARMAAERQAELEQAEKEIREHSRIENRSIQGENLLLALCRKNGVSVPIRTAGWIKKWLAAFSVNESGSPTYYLYRGGKRSEAAFDVLKNLYSAIA